MEHKENGHTTIRSDRFFVFTPLYPSSLYILL